RAQPAGDRSGCGRVVDASEVLSHQPAELCDCAGRCNADRAGSARIVNGPAEAIDADEPTAGAVGTDANRGRRMDSSRIGSGNGPGVGANQSARIGEAALDEYQRLDERIVNRSVIDPDEPAEADGLLRVAVSTDDALAEGRAIG